MKSKIIRMVARELFKVRPGLIPLVVFTIFLGLINVLIVNQKIVLYMFYLPVIVAAWMLPKRDAVAVAVLATLLVAAYVMFLPETFTYTQDDLLLWSELAIWSGILVVTAYVVSTLRLWTQEAMSNLHRAYAGVLSILSKFIETVDADTEAHSVRVSAWSVKIAEELGSKRAVVEEARIAGMLHDVGKIDVSVEILRKAAALSKEEQDQIREHTSRGAAMVKPVGGMLSHIADAIEAHHEKYDGTGYTGLQGEEIPFVSRIIAVADAFDALLSDRPYRRGMSLNEAMDSITSSAGSHFDPRIVASLQKIVNREGDRAISQALGGPEGNVLPIPLS